MIFTEQFRRDVAAQVDRLRDEGLESWVDRLRAELDDAFVLLEDFPQAGVSARRPLRKLVLRRLPFVVWYAFDEDEVTLLRLFHFRQRR